MRINICMDICTYSIQHAQGYRRSDVLVGLLPAGLRRAQILR